MYITIKVYLYITITVILIVLIAGWAYLVLVVSKTLINDSVFPPDAILDWLMVAVRLLGFNHFPINVDVVSSTYKSPSINLSFLSMT